MKRKIFALFLMSVMLVSLCACNKTPALDTEKEIKVMTLNGTTGFGIAKLMDDVDNKTASLNYDISVETDASTVTSALISGTVDIAALPTNAAATVYNKSNGKVKVVAINTLGVLYLVENGDTINNVSDLKGKTIYVPGQGSNPEYVTAYILEQNGLKVGEDVTLDFTYNAPADLRTAVAAGEVDIAVLPEPMVTIAKSANANLNVALDFTEEWDKVASAGSLTQGCIVVTKEFAESNPNELGKFLEEYEASVNYVNESPESASEMIAANGIFEKSAVALKAIPNCNIKFVAGEDMKSALENFYNVLYNANPASVGGTLPNAEFYYIAK